MYTIIHESPRRLGNPRVLMPRSFVRLWYGTPKLREKLLPVSSSDVRADKEGGVSWAQDNMSDPSGSRCADTSWPCSGRSCVVGPGWPRSERYDDRNLEYSPSRISSPSPVSPWPTFYDINSTLSVAWVSVQLCPQASPPPPPMRYTCPVTVRLFPLGPRWGLPQKSALPPLATPPSPPPHTESLCCGTVPGNTQQCTITYPPLSDGTQWRLRWTGASSRLKRRRSPGFRRLCCSLLSSFLPPHNGRNRRPRGIRQRRRGCRLGVGKAPSWIAANLPPNKWWKYEGLGLNCWQ